MNLKLEGYYDPGSEPKLYDLIWEWIKGHTDLSPHFRVESQYDYYADRITEKIACNCQSWQTSNIIIKSDSIDVYTGLNYNMTVHNYRASDPDFFNRLEFYLTMNHQYRSSYNHAY